MLSTKRGLQLPFLRSAFIFKMPSGSDKTAATAESLLNLFSGSRCLKLLYVGKRVAWSARFSPSTFRFLYAKEAKRLWSPVCIQSRPG